MDMDCKEPISESKIQKGDATWAPSKIILGWLIDTVQQTIQLPAHHAQWLQLILAKALAKARVSCKNWQHLLGELCSMVTGISGSRNMFSLLQCTLAKPGCIQLSPFICQCLADWQWLASKLYSHPTPLHYHVPTAPAYVGTIDVSKQGMGGLWVPAFCTNSKPEAGNDGSPYVWWAPFPLYIQDQLV